MEHRHDFTEADTLIVETGSCLLIKKNICKISSMYRFRDINLEIDV